MIFGKECISFLSGQVMILQRFSFLVIMKRWYYFLGLNKHWLGFCSSNVVIFASSYQLYDNLTKMRRKHTTMCWLDQQCSLLLPNSKVSPSENGWLVLYNQYVAHLSFWVDNFCKHYFTWKCLSVFDKWLLPISKTES